MLFCCAWLILLLEGEFFKVCELEGRGSSDILEDVDKLLEMSEFGMIGLVGLESNLA